MIDISGEIVFSKFYEYTPLYYVDDDNSFKDNTLKIEAHMN